MVTKSDNKDFFYAIGRRKRALAKTRLRANSQKFLVNNIDIHDYFKNNKLLINKLNKPFITLDIPNNFNIETLVSGGGKSSQIDAINLSVSKCLIQLNPDFKSTLKRADLLKRDPREKERKKFGLLKARKKRQFTKR
ncbi:MAG: 30S ribosomal protein S9 [Patescibacteria group bacterium]|jgi:Ribosomal protein S9|nr:30S ribosomal protein S9 [Patescibacteria group bacterium]